MDDYKQIFLEFEENTMYKPSEVVNKLLNIYPELGNEIILPINMQEESKDVPIFVFSQNSNFQIQGNFYNVIITVNGEYEDKFKEIIEKIFNVFNGFNINFVGIACYYQEHIDNEKKVSFMKKTFNNYDEIQDDEIHLSIIKKVSINDKETRCLEGYSTLNDDFVSHFEFNMKREDFHILDINYITSFVDDSINYKEERIKCL